MRVLMLTWEYPPSVVGGLGKHVADLVPALLSIPGMSIDVVTPRRKEGAEEEDLGANGHVYRVEVPPAGTVDFYDHVLKANPKLEGKAREIIRSTGPYDLIHAHDWLVAFAANSLKHTYKIPLLSTIHATEKGRVRGELHTELQRAIHGAEWWLSYESWRVITTSQYMAGQVHDFFSLPIDKLDVIPNGVETAQFDVLDGVDLSHFRRHYAGPAEKIVFFVGRLVWEKGVQVLVRAAPEILQQMPDTKFVVAGTGPLKDPLRDQAESMGVGSKFFFTGFIPDDHRDKLFKVADVGVFPSLYEPFGIVALEAMAAKLPVVVSETGGLSEVVENNETGIKVHADDESSLAWGITHTLGHLDWTGARVANAYRVVQSQYNWQKIARDTAQLYERVVRERQQSDWGK